VRVLQSILHWLGFGLCHQLPERSFFGGGVQVPVCARDTGIYIGFWIGFALIAVLQRGERPAGLPSPIGWVAFTLMIGSMAVDGGTEYAGLRPTTNDLRLITGLLSGYAISMLVVPMLNDCVWRVANPKRVLDPGWKLAVWLATVPLSYAAVWWGAPLMGVGYPVLVAIAILGTLTYVNMVLVCVTPWFERKASRPRDLLAPVLVAFALTLIEVSFAGMLRVGLLALASRIQ